MVYRFNERENVLREQYEVAKADLEGLAKIGNYNTIGNSAFGSGRIDNALVNFGFKKETIFVGGNALDLHLYTRETESGLEVLADKDLLDYSIWNKETHLYQIPSGKNVKEWYNSIPDLDRRRKEYNSKIGTTGLFSMMGGLIGGSLLGYVICEEAGAAISAVITSLIIGGGFLVYRESKKHPLHKQTLAKGPEALRYIANTSFDDFVKYQNLRIEEQLRIENQPEQNVDEPEEEEDSIPDTKGTVVIRK